MSSHGRGGDSTTARAGPSGPAGASGGAARGAARGQQGPRLLGSNAHGERPPAPPRGASADGKSRVPHHRGPPARPPAPPPQPPPQPPRSAPRSARPGGTAGGAAAGGAAQAPGGAAEVFGESTPHGDAGAREKRGSPRSRSGGSPRAGSARTAPTSTPRRPSPRGGGPKKRVGASAATTKQFLALTPLHSCSRRPPQPTGCGERCWSQVGDASVAGGLVKGGPMRRFDVPSVEVRRAAIGGHGGVPFLMQRILRFAEVWFEPVPQPRTQDWLSQNQELMQTYDAFRAAFEQHRNCMGPSLQRKHIHLVPFGPSPFAPKLLAQLRALLAAFFSPLRVTVLRKNQTFTPLPGKGGAIDADAAVRWVARGVRTDSVLTIGLTAALLKVEGARAAGASDWAVRVGVFSVRPHVLPGVQMDDAQAATATTPLSGGPTWEPPAPPPAEGEEPAAAAVGPPGSLAEAIGEGEPKRGPTPPSASLPAEASKIAHRMCSRLKAAAYVTEGQDWDKLFHFHDKDKSGKICFEEFRTMCLRTLKLQCEMTHLKTVFQSLDLDNSGEIDIDELVAFVDDPVLRLRERLRDAAKKIAGDGWTEFLRSQDADGSGQLDWEEFCEMCRAKIRLAESDTQLWVLFDALDADASGTISVAELVAFVEGGEVPRPAPPAPQETQRGHLVARSPEDVEMIAKLLTHQAAHMFGLLHCCYYRCLMNGAAGKEEADSRPPYLCGMCLKKLHLVLGFEPVERYLALAQAWSSMGCEAAGRWYELRVGLVRSTLATFRTPRATPSPRPAGAAQPQEGLQLPSLSRPVSDAREREEPHGAAAAGDTSPAAASASPARDAFDVVRTATQVKSWWRQRLRTSSALDLSAASAGEAGAAGAPCGPASPAPPVLGHEDPYAATWPGERLEGGTGTHLEQSPRPRPQSARPQSTRPGTSDRDLARFGTLAGGGIPKSTDLFNAGGGLPKSTENACALSVVQNVREENAFALSVVQNVVKSQPGKASTAAVMRALSGQPRRSSEDSLPKFGGVSKFEEQRLTAKWTKIAKKYQEEGRCPNFTARSDAFPAT